MFGHAISGWAKPIARAQFRTGTETPGFVRRQELTGPHRVVRSDC